eukprot:scaffold3136_cov123-Isochrysis_galbana.AAC.3
MSGGTWTGSDGGCRGIGAREANGRNRVNCAAWLPTGGLAPVMIIPALSRVVGCEGRAAFACTLERRRRHRTKVATESKQRTATATVMRMARARGVTGCARRCVAAMAFGIAFGAYGGEGPDERRPPSVTTHVLVLHVPGMPRAQTPATALSVLSVHCHTHRREHSDEALATGSTERPRQDSNWRFHQQKGGGEGEGDSGGAGGDGGGTGGDGGGGAAGGGGEGGGLRLWQLPSSKLAAES